MNISRQRGRLVPALMEATNFRLDLLKRGNEGGREHVQNMLQGLLEAYQRLIGGRVDGEMYVSLAIEDSGRPVLNFCNHKLTATIDPVYFEAWLEWCKANGRFVSFREWRSLGIVFAAKGLQ